MTSTTGCSVATSTPTSQEPEFSRSSVLRVFNQEAEKQERPLSNITLEQHFETFLHTYVPTRSRKGDIQEDNLDCPLIELPETVTAGSGRGGPAAPAADDPRA